ncbi:hypothetical protein [Pseudorhodoferax sp.]|uniref:hypothetical protein n=1 Tax=Pseudorhodoferax sp. TaxID=1993553 RepID=UPI002DD66909|nr:hypothetical protein [Pseudorhodoferax sp.]
MNRPTPQTTPQTTHLRDARLRHALEHAPDAQAAPAEATRAAILRHAHEAVAARSAPVRPAPWWTRLARALAGPSRPWNAGFATVLLACVVAGLWWERDVPEPAPPARGPAPAAPAPAPAAREAPRQTESIAPAHVPSADASAAPQAREKAQPAPRLARPQPQPAPQAEPVAPPSPSPSPSPSAAPPAEAPMRTPPPRAEADGMQSAPPPAETSAGAAAPSASRAPAASLMRPAARPAPAAIQDAFGWTALQLQSAPARARSSLPADVLQAIDSLLRTGATAVPADDPMLARITLLHEGGIVLGVLELGSHGMRWTPAAGRAPGAFAARVEPATSQRVRDALGQ